MAPKVQCIAKVFVDVHVQKQSNEWRMIWQMMKKGNGEGVKVSEGVANREGCHRVLRFKVWADAA